MSVPGTPMSLVYLVRHAQASFGAQDYDRLSELGRQQARWLGGYFAEHAGGQARAAPPRQGRRIVAGDGLPERAVVVRPQVHQLSVVFHRPAGRSGVAANDSR